MADKLNSRQMEAVRAGNGPVLIIAGAGSGKTSVLTQRIMHLINKKNVTPDNILAVTFTNKAANEMKERINNQKKSKILDFIRKPGFNIWIGTFHAICLRILYQQINHTEYDKKFIIYDKNETIKLIRNCLKEHDLDLKQYRPNTVSFIIENAKNNLVDADQFQEEAIGFYNKTIAKLYKKYQEELIRNQAIDYGGLIQKTVQLLKNNPEIIELHVSEDDLYHPEEVVKYIQAFRSKGVTVYLHHPSRYKGQYLDIISSSQEMRDYYDWSCRELTIICKQEDVKCVVHCHYASSESSHSQNKASRMELRKRIEEIQRISDQSFLWEDTISGIFSAENPFLLSEIVKPLNLPLTLDISHSFIALKGNNDQLKNHLDRYHPFIHYFHLVDSNGVYHDALPLGKGKIDWAMVKSYVKNKDFFFIKRIIWSKS